MKFAREMTSAVSIRSVSDNAIRIGDAIYRKTVALTTAEVVGDWTGGAVGELTAADFAELIGQEPEIVLLGTGRDSLFAPRDVMFAMARRGIGFEVMNTAAAARTFNVLAGEGRKVAAVLYL